MIVVTVLVRRRHPAQPAEGRLQSAAGQSVAQPWEDKSRLDALYAYDILDSPPEVEFDRLVRLASELCRTPIAALSLVDEKRQWFKAVEGLEVRETDISVSFCKHAIRQRGHFEVPDARRDPRFADNPLVTGAPYIRFYAAAPLVTPSGHALGALMVVDRVPRRLNARQRDQLQTLARQAMIALELRRREVALQHLLNKERSRQSALYQLAGEIVRILGLDPGRETFRDVEHAVLEATEQLRQRATLLDQAKDAIFVKDLSNRITLWNGGAERLYGWTREEALGKDAAELLDIPADDVSAMVASLDDSDEYSGEQVQRCKDGRRVHVHGHLTRVRDEFGQVKATLAIWTDMTQMRRDQEKIHYLAFHDQLTQLPNRTALLDRLSHAREASNRHAQYCALIFLDLDNFKTLNDTLGHDIGDLLLQQVASRLRACVRSVDTVARLGGDEFVVLLEELGPEQRRAAIQAEVTARKIVGSLSEPYDLRGRHHDGSASIGITVFDGCAPSVEELLKQADLAMYGAKQAGRNTLRFFDPRMQQLLHARAALEADLRRASLQQEFALHYQPQLDREGQLQGFEALLRWHHPTRGLVLPDEFIPTAEETGFILTLGRWVLKTACLQMVEWEAAGLQKVRVSVNVSPRQLRGPDFVADVRAALQDSGADPTMLKLELTESMLVTDVPETAEKMRELTALGVRFSLDDFGTGYSSLSILQQLPLDQLKIDQSFVQRIDLDHADDKGHGAIIRSIITLGKSLRMRVIAEGIETRAQHDKLEELGCDEFQGYFLGGSMPAKDAGRLMLSV